jgi:hypothetical protein
MYFSETSDEWNYIHNEDLWSYNKLFLSRVLDYNCGPAGVYVVRPSINVLGMGRFSRIEWLDHDTEHLHPSEFWCERFEGEHLSVDFYNKESSLVVRGIREPNSPLYKWSKWEKIEKKVKFPSILEKLVGNYEWINCELIGNNLIEVHFRRNSDFRHGNSIAIPIWNEDLSIDSKYKYIKDEDYNRKGFLID